MLKSTSLNYIIINFLDINLKITEENSILYFVFWLNEINVTIDVTKCSSKQIPNEK
jgi:hypothetical protein